MTYTYDEHVTRALLMGRIYDWRDGTYCLTNPMGAPTEENMLDCLTLEPITKTDHRRIDSGTADWYKSTRLSHKGPVPWEE